MAEVEGRPSLSTLPVELVIAILGSSRDIQSLSATVLSCGHIYRIFLEAQHQVISKVLFREVDVEVIPEAIAAFESSRLRTAWTRASLLEFITRNLDERKILERSWHFTDAFVVTRLHQKIKQLARDFALQAKQSRYKPDDARGSAISRLELSRYERAFYRFELYCNLYHDLKTPLMSLEERRTTFFSKFSPWENEQLACVHAYLVRLITPG